MNGLSSVILKEFTHLRRDTTALRLVVILPILQLILFGYALNFDVRHIATVVVDQDHSLESRDYLSRLRASQYIDFVAWTASPDKAAKMLKDGTAKVGITIPSGFGRSIAAGGNPQVGVMIDGSDAQVALRARAAFLMPPATLPKGTPDPRMTVLFNPTSRTANFMIPGLIAVILQLVTVALTAFSIVREKEQGTLEQLMVTPVGRLALMIGKLVPYAALALVEMVLIILASDLIFRVPIHGSFFTLMLMSGPFVLASLGLGLLISTIAQTQAQALQFSMMTIMPSLLLSGYISPRETLPGWLYLVSFAAPSTFFIQITRGVIVRGAGFADLISPFLILIAFAAALVFLSALRFRKSIA